MHNASTWRCALSRSGPKTAYKNSHYGLGLRTRCPWPPQRSEAKLLNLTGIVSYGHEGGHSSIEFKSAIMPASVGALLDHTYPLLHHRYLTPQQISALKLTLLYFKNVAYFVLTASASNSSPRQRRLYSTAATSSANFSNHL